MFDVATGTQKTFEVGIYNKDVRNAVKENTSHVYFADEWADVRFQNVVAENEIEARDFIKDKYPETDGFVICSLNVQSQKF